MGRPKKYKPNVMEKVVYSKENDDNLQLRYSSQGLADQVLRNREMMKLSPERFNEIKELALRCRETYSGFDTRPRMLTQRYYTRAGSIVRMNDITGCAHVLGENIVLQNDAEKALFVVVFTDAYCNILHSYEECPFDDKEKYVRAIYGFYNFDLIALEKYYSLLSQKYSLLGDTPDDVINR